MAPLGGCLDGGCPLRPSGPEVSPGPVVTAPGVCYPSESGVTSGVRGRRVRARARLELPRTSVVTCPLGNPRWRMMVSLPPRVPLPGGGARDVLAREGPGRDEVVASAGVLAAWYGPLSTAAVAPEDSADRVPSGPLAAPSDAATLAAGGPAESAGHLPSLPRQAAASPHGRLGGRRNLAMPRQDCSQLQIRFGYDRVTRRPARESR
jgi:hypothetical protein